MDDGFAKEIFVEYLPWKFNAMQSGDQLHNSWQKLENVKMRKLGEGTIYILHYSSLNYLIWHSCISDKISILITWISLNVKLIKNILNYMMKNNNCKLVYICDHSDYFFFSKLLSYWFSNIEPKNRRNSDRTELLPTLLSSQT